MVVLKMQYKSVLNRKNVVLNAIMLKTVKKTVSEIIVLKT